MRAGRVLALLLTAAVATACGDGDSDRDRVASVATPSEDPSALQLLDGLGDHGEFDVVVHLDFDVRASGRYVRTAGGGVRTQVDIDLELVEREVAALLAHEERFDSIDPAFRDVVLSEEAVVTDQLRLDLADVLLAAGVLGNAGTLAFEPTFAFAAVDAGDVDECRASLGPFRDAVRRRLAEQRDDLGPAWQPDASALGGEELAAVDRACDGLDDQPPSDEVVLEVDGNDLRVASSGGDILTVRVRPGAGEPAPDPVRPASPLLDEFGLFFVAIDGCGELPWMYSNFAAANSYTSPDEGSYIGPMPFGSTPVCEEDVPD